VSSRHERYRNQQRQAPAATKNAADPSEVKRAERMQLRRLEEANNDLALLASMPEGRRFLLRVFKVTKLEEGIWDPSARIHANEGMRSVGIWLREQLDALDPDIYGKLRSQALKAERQDLLELESARSAAEPVEQE
jgi:hypothetical protein